MKMAAKFRGSCRECGQRIEKGEMIDYEKAKGAAHLLCVGMADGDEFRETVRKSNDPSPEALADRLGFK